MPTNPEGDHAARMERFQQGINGVIAHFHKAEQKLSYFLIL
ncbi:hypothetical protein [[Pseudopropionibacterium] massiliense]|nr:hypothetical protein [[Pseudopropionibacterium] massiliense]